MSDVARAPAVRRALPGDLAGAAARRLRAAAQHGLDGRQPAPAHALRVLPRRRLAVQQARARAAAARRSTGSTAATRSSARASTASPPIPSDVAVALVAFDAVVHTVGPDGARCDRRSTTSSCSRATRRERRAPARARRADRRRSRFPPLPIARRSVYLKFRDRQSYEFALVSVAAALDGATTASSPDVRLALGGVGTKPWRARRAEAALAGAPATAERRSPRAAAAELRPRVGPRAQRVQGRARAAGDRPRPDQRAARRCAMSPAIGTPVNRVDGRAKVTGAARYSGRDRAARPGARRASSARRSRAAG